MTGVTATVGFAPLAARLSQTLTEIRKADLVAYVTLFLVAVFGFTSWYFALAGQLALLAVLLVPAVAKRPALWGVLAILVPSRWCWNATWPTIINICCATGSG